LPESVIKKSESSTEIGNINNQVVLSFVQSDENIMPIGS